MNTTINAGEPSSHATGNSKRETTYDVGLAFFILLFILLILYILYMCKRSTSSQTPPPPIDSDSDDDDRCKRLSASGLDNDILSTFPTFLYSESVKESHNVENETGTLTIDYGSGCSICLVDYKPSNVLRLLPECGHLFHVSCIDTWLKVQPTCPVCRNSPWPPTKELTLTDS